jgi:hypothetical protein
MKQGKRGAIPQITSPVLYYSLKLIKEKKC